MYNMVQVKTILLDTLKEALKDYIEIPKIDVAKDTVDVASKVLGIQYFGRVVGIANAIAQLFNVKVNMDDIDKLFDESQDEYKITFLDKSSGKESFSIVYKIV